MRKSEYEQFGDRNEKEDARQSNAPCSTSWLSDGEGHSEVQCIIPLSARSMGNEECPSMSTGCNAVDWVQTKKGKREQECSAKTVCKTTA